jgi:Holliday junction DNA helicase RuvB
MSQDRMIAPQQKPGESTTDSALRPRNLEDYLGQEEIKERLRIFLDAARARQE